MVLCFSKCIPIFISFSCKPCVNLCVECMQSVVVCVYGVCLLHRLLCSLLNFPMSGL